MSNCIIAANNGYKDYCEKLYKSWLMGIDSFKDFRKDFEPDYLPEPYLIFEDVKQKPKERKQKLDEGKQKLEEGKQTLYVLNYNPGGPMKEIQAKSVVEEKYKGKSYHEIAFLLGEYYSSDEFRQKAHMAWNRNQRVFKFASKLGFESVESLESFFLHSKNINARFFLRKHGDNKQVKDYTELLTTYLEDKPVLIIAAVGAGKSITLDTLMTDKWIGHLGKIASLNLKGAKLYPVTTRGNRTTTCLVANGNKYLSIFIGANNLVMPSDDQFAFLCK